MSGSHAFSNRIRGVARLIVALAAVLVAAAPVSAQDAGCDVVEAGAPLTQAQQERMVELRQKFFGAEFVNASTGEVAPGQMIASWVTVTTFALALDGHVLLLDPYIGDDSGYVPTHDCELSGLRPDYVLIGHGHFDHAELAPTVLNRNRGALFIGAVEHCSDMENALAGIHEPLCIESSPRAAPFGDTRVLDPGVIPGVVVTAVRHPHSLTQLPNLDDPSFLIPDPPVLKPLDFGPCLVACPPPRPNFVPARTVEDGTVSVLYHFQIGDFVLTWNNTVGPNQPGDAALVAMAGLPQTDVQLGAIQSFNNPTNGFHDARVLSEALRTRLYVTTHHDFLVPFSGSAFESSFRGEMTETPAPVRPGIFWIDDPGDYIQPHLIAWPIDHPLWSDPDPVEVSENRTLLPEPGTITGLLTALVALASLGRRRRR